MGLCTDTRPYQERFSLTDAQTAQLLEIIKKMHLQDKHLRTFYRAYKKVDFDGNNTIDKPEFLAWIDADASNEGFAYRTFALQDADSSGTFDFVEFITVVYNYCSFRRQDLIKFAFDLMDDDRSGVLTRDELDHLVTIVYGPTNVHEIEKAKTVLKNLDGDGNGQSVKRRSVCNTSFVMKRARQEFREKNHITGPEQQARKAGKPVKIPKDGVARRMTGLATDKIDALRKKHKNRNGKIHPAAGDSKEHKKPGRLKRLSVAVMATVPGSSERKRRKEKKKASDQDGGSLVGRDTFTAYKAKADDNTNGPLGVLRLSAK